MADPFAEQIRRIQEGGDPARPVGPTGNPLVTGLMSPEGRLAEAVRASAGGAMGAPGPGFMPPGLLERLLMILRGRR